MAVTFIHGLPLISQLPSAPLDAKRATACPFHFDHGSQEKQCPTVQRQAACFDISTPVCAGRQSDVPRLCVLPGGTRSMPPLAAEMLSRPQSLRFESTGAGNAPSVGLRQKWRGGKTPALQSHTRV